MKSAPYDAVISLGQWCATSMLLQKSGLRSASGPFDWMGWHRPLSIYIDALTSEFESFMRKENLTFVENEPCEGMARYRDGVSGLVSVHDFRMDVPFDEMYVSFRDKLDRRTGRLLSGLRGCGRFLFVHFRGEGHYAAEEITDDWSRLRTKFPTATLDLLVLETDRSAPSPRREVLARGVTRIVGDFYDQTRFDAVLGNDRLTLKVLRAIRVHGRWRNLLRERWARLRRKMFRGPKA